MTKRNSFANLLLPLLALGVLGATVSEYIVAKSGSPATWQEKVVEERFEEELEEDPDFFDSWDVFQPRLVEIDEGCRLQSYFSAPALSLVSVHSLGWRMPLRI